MKKLLTILALFALTNCFGQSWFPPQPSTKTYTHLIIYQKQNNRLLISGGIASPGRQWETSTAIFESEASAMEWLNTSSRWVFNDKQKMVMLSEGELIGFYDLRTATKIELVLRAEKKRQERKVEVVTEADEWEDYFYEKQ